MCCRCPPSVGLYIYIYILLTVIASFYFQHTKSIYLKNLHNIHSIRDCHGFDNSNFTLNIEMGDIDISRRILQGNVTFDFEFDEDVRVTLKGTEASGADSNTMKTYINNKSFCKIMDNFIYYHIAESGQRSVSLCPFQAGFYEIYGNNPEFNDVAMPLGMLAHKTFQLELIHHEEKIVCKQLQFINGLGDNSL